MSITTDHPLRLVAALVLGCVCWGASASEPATFGFGSVATPEDLQSFVSPLPDGRGLPDGQGTVEQGKVIYQAQCVACHGDKLQGGLGDRLIGGRQTLVNSDPTKAPVKTVESYWPYATTLFDYVKRAMPLYSPGSLSNDEVYAVTAYILSEAKIVSPDAMLGKTSLAQIKMPNREGFIRDRRPDKFERVAQTPHSK